MIEEPGDPEFAEDSESAERAGTTSNSGEDKVLELFTLLVKSVTRTERKLDQVIEWINNGEDDLK